MKKSFLSICIFILFVSSSTSKDCCKYEAFITNVYDGDTVTVKVFLGMDVYTVQKIRLYGINAPEIRGSTKIKGYEARDALIELIYEKKVLLETLKDKKGKYGRYLCILYIEKGNDTINVNEWLVDNGFAEARN